MTRHREQHNQATLACVAHGAGQHRDYVTEKMKILSSFHTLYFSIKNGWHTGKGSKYLKRKDNVTAIKHFVKALKYSEKTDNKANVACAHEFLAGAYLRTGEYDTAEEHANHSIYMYTQFLASGSSDIFSKRLSNTKQLLKKIRYKRENV